MTKILFLEDNVALGQLYSQKLQQAGFEILWLESVTDIEQKARFFQPEILIIDHGMQGESASGLDIIPKLKKLLPQSKILMLSNYSQFKFEKAALQAGAIAFLVKINTPPKALVAYLKKLS